MGDLDPVTFGGHIVDRRTAAMLTEAQRIANVEDPTIGKYKLTQGCWCHGAQSAGTHAGPGAFDMYTAGYSEHQKQIIGMAFRKVGFASWKRTRIPGTWEEHWHGIAIGTKGLPSVAQNQVTSYKAGHNGLRGNGLDPDPRPKEIHTWEQYKQQHVADMQPADGLGGNGQHEVMEKALATGGSDPYEIAAGGQLVQDSDTDHDGLTDAFEKLAGTSARLADTDSDGLTDAYEAMISHTDPLSADSDGDLVSDAAELAAGSDPGRLPGMAGVIGTGAFAENIRGGIKDADHDGLSDRTEQLLRTNARVADTDGDQLSDAEEIALGTNPLLADSDFDGLTDGLELSYQGDPLSNVPPGARGLPPGLGAGTGAGASAATGAGQYGQNLDPAGTGGLDGGGADFH